MILSVSVQFRGECRQIVGYFLCGLWRSVGGLSVILPKSIKKGPELLVPYSFSRKGQSEGIEKKVYRGCQTGRVAG